MYFLLELERKLKSINIPPANKTDLENLLNNEISRYLQKAILSGEYVAEKSEDCIRSIGVLIATLELDSTEEDEVAQNPPVTLTTKQAEAPSEPQPPAQQAIEPIVNFKGVKDTSITDVALEQSKRATTIQNIRKRFISPFSSLINDVSKSLEDYSNGRQRHIVDTKRFQYYRLQDELSQRLKVDREIQDSIFDDSIFQINILLAYTDEYLECKKTFLYELSSICQFLKDEKSVQYDGEIIQLLLHKAEYLDFKVKYRHAHGTTGMGEELNKKEKSKFKEFYESTILHYNPLSVAEIRSLETEIGKFEKQGTTEYHLAAFHHRNRNINKEVEHKDLDKSAIEGYKTKSDGYISIIGKKTPSSLIIDEVAFKSVSNLLRNTSLAIDLRILIKEDYKKIIDSFRKYIQDGKEMPHFISDYYDEVLKIGDQEDSVQDYHCFIIFLEFLNQFFDFLKSHHQAILDFEDVKTDEKQKKSRLERIFKLVNELNDIYKKALRKLIQKFEMLATHGVRPVYLAKNDCMTKYSWDDGVDSQLFLHSSYVLPNDLEDIKTKIKSFDTSFYSQTGSLRNTFEIAHSKFEIDNKTIEFDKRVKENEFKLVQIVAMFVSIATFVLINVKIFDGKSGIESFGIILGLSSCFFVFNLFFYFVILSQYEGGIGTRKNLKKVVYFIITPIIFAAASGYILYTQGDKTTGDIKVINKTLISDSTDLKGVQNDINALRARLYMDSVARSQLEESIKNLKKR